MFPNRRFFSLSSHLLIEGITELFFFKFLPKYPKLYFDQLRDKKNRIISAHLWFWIPVTLFHHHFIDDIFKKQISCVVT